jgi:hypothetical protein
MKPAQNLGEKVAYLGSTLRASPPLVYTATVTDVSVRVTGR